MTHPNDADNIGLLIKQIHGEISKSFCAVRNGENFTFSQIRVLLGLFPHPNDGLTQRELETMLGVSHPTVVGIVQRLESKGLLRCEVDGKDRRMKRVFPTDYALEQHSRMEQHKRMTEQAIIKGFSPEELGTLRKLLRRAYQNAQAINEKKENSRG